VDIIRVAAFSLSAQQVRSPRNKADHRDWPQLKATRGPLRQRRPREVPSCSTTRSLPRGTPESRGASCLESHGQSTGPAFASNQ
jgi:hypothetical protein